LFNKVFYLGSAPINSPRSEIETIKYIHTIKSQLQTTDVFYREKVLPSINADAIEAQPTEIEIVLSLPRRCDGTVK